MRLSPLCSSAPQDLQQVMVSGPNLNETSIVSGGYGGTAEGIIPTGTIKGNGAGLGGKGDHHRRKGLSSPYCPPLMTQGSAVARPRCLLGGGALFPVGSGPMQGQRVGACADGRGGAAAPRPALPGLGCSSVTGWDLCWGIPIPLVRTSQWDSESLLW